MINGAMVKVFAIAERLENCGVKILYMMKFFLPRRKEKCNFPTMDIVRKVLYATANILGKNVHTSEEENVNMK